MNESNPIKKKTNPDRDIFVTGLCVGVTLCGIAFLTYVASVTQQSLDNERQFANRLSSFLVEKDLAKEYQTYTKELNTNK